MTLGGTKIAANVNVTNAASVVTISETDAATDITTTKGSFSVVCGKQKFESFEGQQVSIFNLSCSLLSGIGFRWQPYAYKMLWQGTLNEAVGNEVEIDGDGTYMVFRTYQRKINE